MENNGTIYKSISHEAASKILCRALSNWKITYHYTKDPGRVELDLENPENRDVMEVYFMNDRIWEITVTRDTEIVIYGVREEKEKLDAVGVLLPMLLSDSNSKIAVATALIHEVSGDTGMCLDEIFAIMKRAIETVSAMEREEEEDD